jgi:hypothetical protein
MAVLPMDCLARSMFSPHRPTLVQHAGLSCSYVSLD